MTLRAPDEPGMLERAALHACARRRPRGVRAPLPRGPAARARRSASSAGLRPLRLPTVAQAVLRAICGQLIEARRARAIERAVIRTCAEPAPTRQAIGRLSPAELRRLGLATHRASALVRLCRTVDLERLRELPIETVEARLLRERGFGRWSLGIVALEGLGSYRHGLVGDLSLVKLCSALRGRWVELAETAELLEPYEEWAGLAGVYLLAGWQSRLRRRRERGRRPSACAVRRAPSRLDSAHGRRAEDRDPRRRQDRRGARSRACSRPAGASPARSRLRPAARSASPSCASSTESRSRSRTRRPRRGRRSS